MTSQDFLSWDKRKKRSCGRFLTNMYHCRNGYWHYIGFYEKEKIKPIKSKPKELTVALKCFVWKNHMRNFSSTRIDKFNSHDGAFSGYIFTALQETGYIAVYIWSFLESKENIMTNLAGQTWQDADVKTKNWITDNLGINYTVSSLTA